MWNRAIDSIFYIARGNFLMKIRMRNTSAINCHPVAIDEVWLSMYSEYRAKTFHTLQSVV